MIVFPQRKLQGDQLPCFAVEVTNMKYLAHRSEDGREQTILQHLEGTAEQCAAFASAFGAEEQGRLAGLSHDIGKYSDAFQKRLDGSAQRVDHATAGAYECYRRRQPFAAFAVAGHHGGLPNGGGKGDSGDSGTFLGRIYRGQSGQLEPYGDWEREITLPSPALPAVSSPDETMFFTRMLYSCLVDADFLDTEAFMDGVPREKNSADMERLWTALQQYIQPWFPPEGELNRQRCGILRRCMEEGQRKKPGLFTLTVPTGGGKTVASLAFALAHAREQGMERVIYVVPYTSIIEQTADTFRKILGPDQVLEHHSGVTYDLEDGASPQTARMAKATENWDMPVIVTTAVQFFESLFANRSSKCRKLHNLAKSVLIFDEAQMLPLPYLRPCVWAISQLVKRYGASAVLCTATQPALAPFFRQYLPHIPVVELCPPEVFDAEVFQRVRFQNGGILTWTALAEQLNAHHQVLCIVNRRKSAQKILSCLQEEGAYHLSTLMYPAHRRQVLEEIHRRLKEGLPCRVVSTSLIEAGVDVDFPAVFREEAGLDSVLQAAGRCNREGKRSPENSVVTLFQGEEKAPPQFRTAVDTFRQIRAAFPDLAAPETIQSYFRQFLYLKGEKQQDVKGILSLMKDPRSHYPFETVADQFRLIESQTRTVYIPRGEGASLIRRLEEGERSRNLFRALGQYGVSVYEQHFHALEQSNCLNLLEDGSAILMDLNAYHPDTGLTLEPEMAFLSI